MKILLTQPSFNEGANRFPSRPPLGLAYLAGSVQKAGHECQILDEQLGENLFNRIESFKPDVVGFSVTTWTVSLVLEKVAYIKANFSNIFCIAGGPHPTASPSSMLKGGIDVVVHGYGEKILIEILSALKNGESFSNIGGISFIHNGKMITNPKVDDVDLNTLPKPAFNLLDLKNYQWCSVSSSRGCPIGCSFCSDTFLFGKKMHFRSPDNFVDELEALSSDFGIKKFYFIDEQFTFNEKRTIEICNQIIKRKLKIDWIVNSRVDRVTQEMLSLMKKSGCISVAYGIESGSEQILKNVHKEISIPKIEKTVALTKNAGIRVKTSWIVGLPGDFSEQLKSVDLMEKIQPNHIDVYWLTIYPGTPFWYDPTRYGIHIDTNNIPLTANEKLMSKTYFYDYLSKEEVIKVAEIMTARMMDIGYKIAGIEENNYDVASKMIATYLRYLNLNIFSHELSK